MNCTTSSRWGSGSLSAVSVDSASTSELFVKIWVLLIKAFGLWYFSSIQEAWCNWPCAKWRKAAEILRAVCSAHSFCICVGTKLSAFEGAEWKAFKLSAF